MSTTKSPLDDWSPVEGVKRKSLLVAYLLWFFLWWAGAHHLYLRRYGSAAGYALLSLVGANLDMPLALIFVIVPVWWTIDLFLLPGLVRNVTPSRTSKPPRTSNPSQTSNIGTKPREVVVSTKRVPANTAPATPAAGIQRSATTFGRR